LNPSQQLRNQQLCGGGTFGGVTVLGSSYSSYRIGNGLGYEGSFDFTERNYGFNIRANGRTKLFRADSGFVKRNDTNQISIGGRISSSPKSEGRLLRATWFNSLESNFAFNGDPQLWTLMSRLGLQLSGSANLSVWGGFANEHLYEYEFGLKRMPSRPNGGAFYGAPVRDSFQEFIGASFDKRFSKKIATSTRFTFTNNEIDFDFGNGNKYPRVSPAALLGSSQYDPGKGKQIEFNQGFSFNPVDSFRSEISYNRQRLTRNDNGRVAFDSQLFGIKTTYQFSRFVFVRARIDYNSIAATVNGQYLFGYTPNPGTAFYVGYNDSLNYNGYNPFTGQYESGINRSSRTFFIRASYLIRKSFKGR
jgi:hypothetical protein